eukprot:4477463-Prymnesium_polylepis.1
MSSDLTMGHALPVAAARWLPLAAAAAAASRRAAQPAGCGKRRSAGWTCWARLQTTSSRSGCALDRWARMWAAARRHRGGRAARQEGTARDGSAAVKAETREGHPDGLVAIDSAVEVAVECDGDVDLSVRIALAKITDVGPGCQLRAPLVQRKLARPRRARGRHARDG